ncbi:unnamed protein product [Hermetia illucens]|uniref:EGF-like domain-containing protein n=1 Tax=Hermetia illucens TaxID=343691 RepID=A0A7R8UTR2_HERIL|nr:unnamed protein product [Hermetia illucens]
MERGGLIIICSITILVGFISIVHGCTKPLIVKKWRIENRTYHGIERYRPENQIHMRTRQVVKTSEVNVSYSDILVQCCDHYQKSKNGIYEPICDPECIHGKCVAPDHCMCDPGFEPRKVKEPPAHSTSSDSNRPWECQRTTSNDTVNHRGAFEETQKKEWSENTTLCTPPCTNSICQKDLNCECFDGYIFAEYSVSDCVPWCEPECINGLCSGPDQCDCYKGYRKNVSNSRPFECEPVCEPACINGTCISPNSCQCWEHYYPIPGKVSNHRCAPCTLDCGNGTCKLPERCDCFKGYYFDAKKMTCVVRMEEAIKSSTNNEEIQKTLVTCAVATAGGGSVGAIILCFYCWRRKSRRRELPVRSLNQNE